MSKMPTSNFKGEKLWFDYWFNIESFFTVIFI